MEMTSEGHKEVTTHLFLLSVPPLVARTLRELVLLVRVRCEK